MTGDAATSTGRRTKHTVIIVSQKGTKVNITELIETLKAQLQELEDAKQQISEAQEDLREAIARIQMSEVKANADS